MLESEATIESALVEHLLRSPRIGARVAERVNLAGDVPQGQATPYLVIRKLAGSLRDRTLSGFSGLVRSRFAVDCVDRSGGAAIDLRETVEAVCDDFRGPLGDPLDPVYVQDMHVSDDVPGVEPIRSGRATGALRQTVELVLWHEEAAEARVSNMNVVVEPDPIGDAIRADLRAYYKLGDTADSGPNGFTLTNTNGVTFSAGKLGNAADFVSGDSTRLERSGSDLDFGNADWSVSLWFKTTKKKVNLFAKGNGNGGPGNPGVYGHVRGAPEGQILLVIGTDTVGSTLVGVGAGNNGYNDGAWHFFCVTCDVSGDIVLKVDNSIVPGGTVAYPGGTPAAPSDPFRLGMDSDSTSFPFQGQIDEFLYLDRELTSTEQDYLWNDGDGKALY